MALKEYLRIVLRHRVKFALVVILTGLFYQILSSEEFDPLYYYVDTAVKVKSASDGTPFAHIRSLHELYESMNTNALRQVIQKKAVRRAWEAFSKEEQVIKHGFRETDDVPRVLFKELADYIVWKQKRANPKSNLQVDISNPAFRKLFEEEVDYLLTAIQPQQTDEKSSSIPLAYRNFYLEAYHPEKTWVIAEDLLYIMATTVTTENNLLHQQNAKNKLRLVMKQIESLEKEIIAAKAEYEKIWGDIPSDGTSQNDPLQVRDLDWYIERYNKILEEITEREKQDQNLKREREMMIRANEELGEEQRHLFATLSSRISSLQEALDGERQRLGKLQVKYTDEHPSVVEANDNIARLITMIDEEKSKIEETEQARFNFEINKIQTARELLVDELKMLYDKRDNWANLLRDVQDKKFLEEDNRRLQDRLDQRREATITDKFEVEKAINEKEVFTFDGVDSITSRKVPRRFDKSGPMVAIIGLIVGIFVVVVAEHMNTKITTEHDVRRHLNLPVLAIVPKKTDEVLLTKISPTMNFAQKFYQAATLMSSSAQDLGLRSFMVSSTIPEEGKTTITINLAIAMARRGKRVIVVDADLHKPSMHEIMGVDNSSGLATILEGKPSASGQTNVDTYLKYTDVDNLRVLTSGPLPSNPIVLLESVRMKALVEELKDMCDYLFFDTPPIHMVGDTLTIATLVDASLFVVGSERVEQHEVAWAKHLLSNVDANILGAVLNMSHVEGKSYYYYYDGYKSYRSRG